MTQTAEREEKKEGLVGKINTNFNTRMGKFVAGTLIFGAGMGVESHTHYAQRAVLQSQIVHHVMEGYKVEGDPQFRNAEIALKVDHDKKEIYGVLRDPSRGIELKINEGLQTKKPFHQAFYEKIQSDIRELGQGIENLGSKMSAGGEEYWNRAKEHYERLSKKVSEEFKGITD